MLRKLLARWKQYKYRFVPWLAANINERHILTPIDLTKN